MREVPQRVRPAVYLEALPRLTSPMAPICFSRHGPWLLVGPVLEALVYGFTDYGIIQCCQVAAISHDSKSFANNLRQHDPHPTLMSPYRKDKTVTHPKIWGPAHLAATLHDMHCGLAAQYVNGQKYHGLHTT